MWGIAVGTTVAAVAVTAAAEDEDEDEEDDEEGEDEAITTTVTTTTATGTTTSTEVATLQGGLPCNPVIKQQDAMTYYVCGDQHFVLAYGGTGPVYIPVPAPP
jgi:hypothetical protein